MKSNVYKTVVGLAAAAILSTGVVFASTAPVYKIGDQFKEPLKGLTGSNYVMEMNEGDLNGDSINDQVLIIGQKEAPEDIYHSKVHILVKDGKTKSYKVAKAGGGYDSEVFIGDFDGDHIDDIATSLNTGGSGGTVENTIVSFAKEEPIYLLNPEESHKVVTFEGQYMDNFKAEITIKEIDKKIVLNLEAKKDMYIENKVYDESGKLLQEVKPWADGAKTLRAVDLNGDGTLEVISATSISGTSHADRISNIDFTMQYIDGNWQVKEMIASQPILSEALISTKAEETDAVSIKVEESKTTETTEKVTPKTAETTEVETIVNEKKELAPQVKETKKDNESEVTPEKESEVKTEAATTATPKTK